MNNYRIDDTKRNPETIKRARAFLELVDDLSIEVVNADRLLAKRAEQEERMKAKLQAAFDELREIKAGRPKGRPIEELLKTNFSLGIKV